MRDRDVIFKCIHDRLQAHARGGQIAVMVLRLHGLRETQVRFGYAAGDVLLQTTETQLRACLRPQDELIAADEGMFLVILDGVHNATHAQLAAVRMAGTFESPQRTSARPWHGRMTMGIALYPEHAADPERLCRLAEMAHDEAHRTGQLFAVYAPHHTRVEVLYDELRDAIQNNQLEVYFQPWWHLASGRMGGVESLARWFRPQRGEVPPADFVGFAEHNDLIGPLSHWSLHASLRHAAELRRFGDLPVAVNLSPRMFSVPGLVEHVLGALDIWSLPPQALCVEVTETAAIHDLELSVDVLTRLRGHGVRVAIDDFGTGYASFSYLRRFPATELKIDMSLIRAMRNEPRTARMVRAMIEVAHHLEMDAVAEGVEDADTLSMLADMGCDLAQGYHLARPRPADELVASLRDHGGPGGG